MLLTYKNEITILYSGECRNTYFEIKWSGGNDDQNRRSCWHITIGDRKRGKILGKIEISRPLHRKAKILWQLENLQNNKDLYGKVLERDWGQSDFFSYKSF